MIAAARTQGPLLLGMLGTACFLGVWELIGRFQLAGLSWPPLTDVLALLADPTRGGIFLRGLAATVSSALIGYVAGACVGLGFTLVTHLLPSLSKGLNKLAAVLNSIPSIALAPIFLVLLSGDATPAAIASIHVFFIMFVSSTSGLKATSAAHQDLFSVFGASNAVRFRLLELPAALPAIVSGLRLSAPVALIGAIIGEWFGASRGIGVLIVNAMQNFQITMLWGAVLLAAGSSLVAYIILTAAERGTYAKFG